MQREHRDARKRRDLRQQREARAEQRRQIEVPAPLRVRLLEFVRLGQQGAEHEERGEHVLAAHHPRHRLHVHRQHREGAGNDERDAGAPRRARQEPEQQRDVRRVQKHVAEVVADGVLEAEEARIERPRDVAQQQWLFAREVRVEDLREAREEARLVVERRVREQHLGIVEVDELEADRARVEREARKREPERAEQRRVRLHPCEPRRSASQAR